MVKGQRTKGNTKPSSSSRTAELLASSSGAVPLIGFAALSVGKSDEDNEVDLELDPDFRLVFKKMTKKDSVTKVKALQEFSQLCQNKEEETIKQTLVQWSKIYVKLAVDYDSRVREETHKSHEQVLHRVGRSIAPHLKQLMPFWLTSQFDPYAPAASAAKSAFDYSFPACKRPEVFDFTKKQILKHVEDVLLNHTPQTVGDPQVASPDEIQAKYNRLVSTSLQGLTLFISSLSSNCLSEVEESMSLLLNDKKFWKFSKSEDAMIRSCWYHLLSCLCQNMPKLVNSYAAKICSLTLGSLDEVDLVVAAPLWECALSALITVDDCWSHVNFKKAFWPQLKRFLRRGGNGNAKTLYPNLLPLFSRITYDLLEDPVLFYNEFFTCIREGILQISSISECNCVVRGFTECARYFIVNSENLVKSEESLQNIINYQFSELLNSSFIGMQILCNSNLYEEFVDVLRFLKKQSTIKEDKFKKLLKLLIVTAKEISFENIRSLDSTKISRCSLFIQKFGSDEKSIQKQSKKLRFRRESDEDFNVNIKMLKASSEFIDIEEFQDFVSSLTRSAVDLYNSQKQVGVLELLLNLIRLNSSKTLSFLTQTNENEGVFKFWDLYLNKWIKSLKSDSEVRGKSQQLCLMTDMAFLLTFLVDSSKKTQLLDDLIKNNDTYITERIFSRINYSNISSLNDWLKSETFGCMVAEEASKLIIECFEEESKENEVTWKVINYCFACNKISDVFLEQIIDKFRKAIQTTTLKVAEEKSLQQLVDFTCKLASNLFSNYDIFSLESAKNLLLTIFSLNCDLSIQSQVLKDAWSKGVEVIAQSTGAYLSEGSVLLLLADEIKQRLRRKLKQNSIKMTLNCILILLKSIHKSLPSQEDGSILANPVILAFLEKIFLSDLEWKQLEETNDCVLNFYWIDGHILWEVNNCKFDQKLKNQDTNELCINSAILTTKLIRNLIMTNEKTISKEVVDLFASQLKHLFLVKVIADLNFLNHVKTLEKSLTEIIKENEESDLKDVVLASLIVLSKNNLFYAIALRNFLELTGFSLNLKPKIESLTYQEVTAFQQLCKFLPQEIITEVASDLLNSFLCCQNFADSKAVFILTMFKSCLCHIDQHDVVPIILESLNGIKCTQKEIFFFEKQLTSSEALQFCCCVIDIFAIVVEKFSRILNQSHWDFILCSLTSWIINFVKQQNFLFENLAALIFSLRTLNLVQVVGKSMQTIENESFGPENLLLEWNDFHSKNIYIVLCNLFVEFCESDFICSSPFNSYVNKFFNYLAKSLLLMPMSVIPELTESLASKQQLIISSAALDSLSYEIFPIPAENEKLINNFSPLIICKYSSVQIASYSLTSKALDYILTDSTTLEITKEVEEILLSPPQTILSLLLKTDQIVDALLLEVAIGDGCCIVEPQTDSFTYTLAYLLLWSEVLEIFSKLVDETRSQFTSFLKNSNLLSRFLENLFRLMPVVPGNEAEVKLLNGLTADSNELCSNPILKMNRSFCHSDIQKLSIFLYYFVLRKLPALVRGWWNNLDKRTADVVNKFTSTYFSSHLCALEVDSVQSADVSKFKNLTIKARPAAREVLAIYKVEDITIELLIQLPQNHPLGPVSVDCGKRVGVSSSQWRNWLLQLTVFLTHQNGSILGGLLLWKRNVEKRFEGVEECMICFYVLHGATYQLPKLQCRTCKKRYHSACLYKWFNTSNNATCPLCRNIF